MKKIVIYTSIFLATVLVSSTLVPDYVLADRDAGTATDDRDGTVADTNADTATDRDASGSRNTGTDSDRGTDTGSVDNSTIGDGSATATSSVDRDTEELESLQDIVVDQPEEIPGGIFWKKIGQKLVLFFTFDAIKDAEKKLEYAEENILLAEFIIENTDSKSDQELAAELIDVANDYVQSITEKSQQLLDAGEGSEEVKILFENLAIHTQNKQMLLDNIKNLVDLTQIPKLDSALLNANQLNTGTANALMNAGTVLKIESLLVPKLTIPAAILEFLKNDQDGDGLLDSKEDELGTSKFDFDTDHDGISDVQEFEVTKTDPLKADTDGDGYWDGYELINGFSPVGAQKLDKFPTKAIQNIDPTTGLIKDLQPKQLTPGGLDTLAPGGLAPLP